jgi:hypothetical protein
MMSKEIDSIIRGIFGISQEKDLLREIFPLSLGQQLYHIRIVTADKPIFYFDRPTWNKIYLVPRPWTYLAFLITDPAGREIPLTRMLGIDGNPFCGFFSSLLFDLSKKTDDAHPTYTPDDRQEFETGLRGIALLAEHMENPWPFTNFLRTAGRCVALPFYPAYFLFSQIKAILGIEGSNFRPRLTWPFYIADVRKLCILVDDLRLKYGCIRTDTIFNRDGFSAEIFDIEVDPQRLYWGRVRTRINFYFAGDSSSEAVRNL